MFVCLEYVIVPKRYRERGREREGEGAREREREKKTLCTDNYIPTLLNLKLKKDWREMDR